MKEAAKKYAEEMAKSLYPIPKEWDDMNYSQREGFVRNVESHREAYLAGASHGDSEKELDDLAALKDYWFNRCYQAEQYIEASPCDPDVTIEQIEAHRLWVESKQSLPTAPKTKEETKP